MGRFIECCCESLGDALEAQKGGAGRVELCTDLSVGGVTPPIEMIQSVVKALSIPVNVLVRPRGGDFVFTQEEVKEMMDSIIACKSLGVNGVVIGALTPEGDVDIPVMERLISVARPLSVTFHRAFDVCRDPLEAFSDIKHLGCDRLLTSGHECSAFKGRFLIAELVKEGGGTVVMAGCGVRVSNIDQIQKDSDAPEYHSTSHGASGHTECGIVRLLVGND